MRLLSVLALLLLAPLPAAGAPAGPGAVPSCDGRQATIVGTAGDDRLVGTAGPDVIVGLGGDDRIEAGAGDDVVCGLAGADRIDAGPGDDRVFGGIDAWSSDRGGTNRIGDRVWPGPGDDLVDLGADRRPGQGTLERDTLVYRDLDHAITADLSPGVGSVEADGTDTVRVHGQLGVVGTRFADTIIGSPKADTLRGLGGDDELVGRGGRDLLLPGPGADRAAGSAGDDTIDSWAGADVLTGGTGDDFVETQGNPDVATVALGPGDDQLNADVRPRGGFDGDGGTGRDTIVLAYTRHHDLPPADLDLATGTVTLGAGATGRLASFEWWVMLDDQPLTVHGTDAAERIEAGGHSPVRAWMGGGDDAVFASGADDYVDSGPGEDLVWAYGGTDTCLHTEHARDCEVRQARTSPRPAPATCAGRRATMVGTDGPDHLRGTPHDDVIVGLAGDDRIDGLGGDDVVCGGPGDDDLTSYDDGHDVLVGGIGDDFVGSFENPHVRVRLGPGDDYASSQVGRGTGWSLDAGPGHDRVYLHLTRALYDAGPKDGAVDLGAGTLRVDGGVAGRFASWEDVDLPATVRWRARGTDADERFYFEGINGVDVRAGGGDDTLFGTIGSDRLDGGAGEDTVTAYGGRDTCRRIEHTRGCDGGAR